MKLEDQVRLSFYTDIASVDKRHGVVLVQNNDTGKVYVKKTLHHFNRSVFETLKNEHYTGVPTIKELIESDDTLIVIEDYISGHSIDELLNEGPFNLEAAVSIVSELCDILDPIHSHEPSIIHRDIKASNVIVDNEGKVYLIDFDASKKVSQGQNRDTDLIGTEEYAAPEQYGFGQSDQRTDIYALGILLNKLLTGKLPSDERYAGDIARVISRATELDPSNRYQNVRRLQMALYTAMNRAERQVIRQTSLRNQPNSNTTLNSFLLKLPYIIRELPGFRSGRVLYFGLALAWYFFLISFGFFGVSSNPEYSQFQNRFFDIATFALLFIPTLYVGNYLGVRDRLPWKKSPDAIKDIVRIIIGVIISIFIVILAVSFFATVLNV